jgi:hypothetical protein
MASVTLTFSNITNNGKPCKDPIILIQGADNVAFPCGDKVDENGQIKLTVPDSLFGERQCITGVIKCAECDSCKEEDFKICLCDYINPCENCQECVDGICVEKCPDPKKCVEGKCCDCEEAADCGKGYICNGCNCICPTGYKNSQGDCVECLTNAQCGPCEECINGECVSKCAPGLICDGTECKCPPGTKYNPSTGKCERIECSKDSDCAECETCVAGECVPIVCPEGYKCVDGECIKWPCKDVKCSNGADCGEGCGCVNGECIPCYLLNCDTTADLTKYPACAGALGCECNGLKCEPVDNCGQYCDGSTPCLDPECTCYNNECVSCKNFPCDPDQCSDKYNCGCNGGECGGSGEGCNDKFTLAKKENCEADGCELEATFTTEKGCKCDPIEFKTKNVFTIPADTPTAGRFKILELNVDMYKNGVKYSNFRNIATMGDDELVDATIKTIVTHRVNGNIVNPGMAQVTPVSPDIDNVIPTIPINFSHVSASYNGSPTVVTIEVRAESIKVENNGCVGYKSDIIATYELDFRTAASWTLTKSTINGAYKTEVSKKLTDQDSVRRPLFVWYKSNTGNFGSNKFQNNGTYAQNGFFRKEYGIASGGSWKDKINNPAAQTLPNQTNELWNNYNYKAAVDCGCGSGSSATINNVVFCCTEKIKYTMSNCGRTITVPPFTVCSVNKNLASLTASGYKTPQEAQTYFWMIINGTKEILLRSEGGEILGSSFTYTHESNINSIKFEQRYKGSPLVEKACEKNYTEEYVGPDFNVTAECGKIVVTKIPTTPNISTVTAKKGNVTISFTPSQNNTVWTATNDALKMNGDAEVTVSFTGSCTLTKKVTITCAPEIKATPTGLYAKGECPEGVNPDIVVEVVSGFTSNVKFSRDGVNYVSPDSTSPVIKKTFTNFAAGTYTLYAKETINGVETILTKIVQILSPIKPALIKLLDICGNTPGSVQITNAAPNSIWRITGLGVANLQFTIGTDGKSSAISIPATGGGIYTATLDSDPSGSTCLPQILQVEVKKGGGTITPQIILEQNSICQGSEVRFRINDGGANLTYNVQVDGGSTVGYISNLNTPPVAISQLAASNTFNAKLNLNPQSNVTSVVIKITSISGQNCYTLQPSNISATVTVNPGPNIRAITIQCDQQQINKYNVSVQINGTASAVTIGGESLSFNPSTQVWEGQSLVLSGPSVQIIATNLSGTCQDLEVRTLPDCNNINEFCLLNQTVEISGTPASPTCGSQNVTIGLNYSTLGNITGEQYAWYEVIGSVESLITSGTILGAAPPAISVFSDSTPREYMLVIKTKNGVCEYYSNNLEVVAGDSLNPQIVGSGITPDTTPIVTGSTYSYSTGSIPGATYSWTLTNSNGSNQPIGTNSNVINISNFAGGSNTINVTVTVGNCTGTGSASVNVGLTCPDIDLWYFLPGDDTCRGVQVTINNMPSGVTSDSFIWYIDGVPAYSGTGTPISFGTAVVEAGSTVDITVQITFSNGCVVTSEAFSYTRCACLCENSICGTTRNFTNGTAAAPLAGTYVKTENIGTFQSGDVFDFSIGISGNSNYPHRARILLDGVDIFDTGFFLSRQAVCGGFGAPCESIDVYLGDEAGTSGYSFPVGTANIGPVTSTVTCNRVSGPGAIFGSITLPSDGLLTLETINRICSPGGGPSQTNIEISCP